MRNLFLMLCLAATLPALSQVASLRWDVQQDRPVATDIFIYQGETVDLIPRLVQGTAPIAITNAPVTFRYREPSLTNGSYRTVDAANPAIGTLTLRWTPTLDIGASYYEYQFIVGSTSLNPRVHGRIMMRPTLGTPPSTEAPDAVAGYATPAALQALSNALASAVQSEAAARISGDTALSNHVAQAIAEIPPPTPINLATASVAYAISAGSASILVGTNSFITTAHGTTTQWRVTATDTNRVWIVSASTNFNGPPVGTQFPDAHDFGAVIYGSKGYVLPDYSSGVDWLPGYSATLWSPDIRTRWDGTAVMPAVLTPIPGDNSEGTCTIDWGLQTNAYTFATTADLATHNTSPTSHADIRQAISDIEAQPGRIVAGDITIKRWQMWDWGISTNRYIILTNDVFEIWE